MIRSLFILMVMTGLSSCTLTKVLKQVKKEEAELIAFRSEQKTVYFIPMVHIGQPEFYADVYRKADSLKALGFVVFHEGTKDSMPTVEDVDRNYQWVRGTNFHRQYATSSNRDSIVMSMYLRKLRKMLGFFPDTLKYAQHFHEKGFFKNTIDQPRFHELKTDERDLNVDVSITGMVNEYERRYGFIELTATDFSMPLSAAAGYVRSQKLPTKNVKDVIINYRDEYLAREIEASKADKIVVIYGLMHVDGTFEQLQKLNPSWKR